MCRIENHNQIIKLISEHGASIRLNEIAKAMGVVSDSKDYEDLKLALDELVDKKLVSKSSRRRYSLPGATDNGVAEAEQLTGVFKHDTNISYFFPDDDSKKKRVDFADSLTALHGDRVRVSPKGGGKKATVKVLEVLERAEHKLVGTVESDGLDYYLVPDDKHYHIDFLLLGDRLENFQPMQKVVATFEEWESVGVNPAAKLMGAYSNDEKIKSLFATILDEYKLNDNFASNLLEEAERHSIPGGLDKTSRKDVRHLDIITIDPADARDFDDALSLEKLENGNHRIGIHIADVSSYITEGSDLDTEAKKRGNSVYLVDRVVPMLPEHISNTVCSLNPHEDRNAFSVFVEMTKLGRIVDYEITETLINSKRRFSYEEAQEVLDSGVGDYRHLLGELNDLAKKLKKKRFKTGGIEFETTETRYRTDETGYPAVAEIKSPTESTKLIEEFMLLANRVVAGFVKDITKSHGKKGAYPYLFRIHEQPEPEMLKTSLDFISRLGNFKHDKKNTSSAEINRILKSFEGKPEKSIVNSILIRSMAKAVYSQVNMGHYGLGFKDYSHFTSPIRRYPDLIVHRLIKEYQKGKPDPQRLAFLKEEVREIGVHCSATERTAMEAERASKKVAGAILANDHKGEEFEGTITGIMHFGIFVQLDELLCEGLVHIRDLNDDYYTYDENNFMLRGRKGNNKFKAGDRVKVRIVKVMLKKREIDLDYLGRIEN